MPTGSGRTSGYRIRRKVLQMNLVEAIRAIDEKMVDLESGYQRQMVKAPRSQGCSRQILTMHA